MKKKIVLLIVSSFGLFVAGPTILAKEQPEKLNIAVAEFEARDVAVSQAVVVSDFLRTDLVKMDLFNVVSRSKMQMILAEQKFQMSGCTDQECIIEMGGLLNVEKMVFGNLARVGQLYYITASVIDVETAKIVFSERMKFDKLEQMSGTVNKLAAMLANHLLGKRVSIPARPEVILPRGKKEVSGGGSAISGRPKEIIAKEGAAMVFIPAGEFMMGSPRGEGDDDEHPRHKVYLDAYYIDKYEVTNEQYAKFLNEYGKAKDDNGKKMIYEHKRGVKKRGGRWEPGKGYENHPVIYVTWYGANQYAKFYGKRLPTEAEWEKACRAGSNTKYCFGDSESTLLEYGWYFASSRGKTHPVGTNKPNKWGISDMLGNVWEWCSDWYDENYYKNSLTNNPGGPRTGSERVLRGGSWNSGAWGCRSANRDADYPGSRSIRGGFRCVRSGAR